MVAILKAANVGYLGADRLLVWEGGALVDGREREGEGHFGIGLDLVLRSALSRLKEQVVV